MPLAPLPSANAAIVPARPVIVHSNKLTTGRTQAVHCRSIEQSAERKARKMAMRRDQMPQEKLATFGRTDKVGLTLAIMLGI